MVWVSGKGDLGANFSSIVLPSLSSHHLVYYVTSHSHSSELSEYLELDLYRQNLPRFLGFTA